MKEELSARLHHISFHTPGHNGGVFGETSKFDITELSYSDNLLSPTGVIAETEKKYAERYGAERALLFTNGATGAIFAAVFAGSGKIAILGGAHASVFRAVRAFRKRAVWCADVAELEKQLRRAERGEVEKIAAVFFTSPDYFGRLADIRALQTLKSRYAFRTICDSAHGSHFAFSSKLPISATEYADTVIYSLHKTLPVLTGGAMIACKAQDADKLFYARLGTHTTSPSYLTLVSMDEALSLLENAERDYEAALGLLELFTDDIVRNTPFRIAQTDDKTRLVVLAEDALRVQRFLEQNNVYCEFAEESRLIFIVTPYNKQHLAGLAVLLKEYAEKNFSAERSANGTTDGEAIAPPKKYYELKEIDCDVELLPIERAAGKTLAAEVGLYPPGIPFLFAGEVLTAKNVEFLQKNKERLFGLADKGIFVVK